MTGLGRILAAILLACLPLAGIDAQTWSGGGPNDFWTTGANWSGGVAPVNDGTAQVVFFGNARTTPDLDANYSVETLRFIAGAPSYVLGSTGGFTLTIGGLLSSGDTTQQSPRNPTVHAQTVNVALAFSRDTLIAGTGSDVSNFPGLTLNGPINTSGHDLNFSSTTESFSTPYTNIPIVVNGAIGGSGGIVTEAVAGYRDGGALTLTANNTYTGATALTGGRQLNLFGNSASLGGTSAVTLVEGAQLLAGDAASTVANPDRLNDAVTVRVGRGELILTGSNNASTTHEVIGAIALNGGQGTITVQPASNSSQAELDSSMGLTRNVGATALVRGPGLGAAPSPGNTEILLGGSVDLVGGGGTPGTHSINIVPFLTGGTSASDAGSTFVTYGSNGLRTLDVNTEFSASTTTAASTDNVRVTQNETLFLSRTINSLVITNPTSDTTYTGLTLAPGVTLRVSSGAVLFGLGYITGGTLDFGAAEGVLTNAAPFQTSISSIIGSGGATFTGPGGFLLEGQNTYTGPTYINTFVEIRSTNSALGASGPGNEVIINDGGSLILTGGVTLNKDIRGGTFGSSPVVNINSANGEATINGTIRAAEPDPQLPRGTSNLLIAGPTVNGDIIGASSAATALIINGSAKINGAIRDGGPNAPLDLSLYQGKTVLNGASSYSGRTDINAGASLVVNGSITGAGDMFVTGIMSNPAHLAGSGKVELKPRNSIVLNAGIIAPGDPAQNGGVGVLTIGSLANKNDVVANNDSGFEFQLGAISDKLIIFGGLNLAGPNIKISLYNAGDAMPGVYKLIDYTDALTGSLNKVALQLPFGWRASLIDNQADTSIDVDVEAVPEPQPFILFFLGAGILGLVAFSRLRSAMAISTAMSSLRSTCRPE